ncbi:hypothetical protein BKA69DRAFT_1034763 [Paraphysoderma sedebokerense]|nr:hypothetical protein BKA69DRAFT_1034763 [Paraphysoderma sedebokerense]
MAKNYTQLKGRIFVVLMMRNLLIALLILSLLGIPGAHAFFPLSFINNPFNSTTPPTFIAGRPTTIKWNTLWVEFLVVQYVDIWICSDPFPASCEMIANAVPNSKGEYVYNVPSNSDTSRDNFLIVAENGQAKVELYREFQGPKFKILPPGSNPESPTGQPSGNIGRGNNGNNDNSNGKNPNTNGNPGSPSNNPNGDPNNPNRGPNTNPGTPNNPNDPTGNTGNPKQPGRPDSGSPDSNNPDANKASPNPPGSPDTTANVTPDDTSNSAASNNWWVWLLVALGSAAVVGIAALAAIRKRKQTSEVDNNSRSTELGNVAVGGAGRLSRPDSYIVSLV